MWLAGSWLAASKAQRDFPKSHDRNPIWQERVCRVIQISKEIQSRIASAVEGKGALSFPIDYEACSHGAIALMGTIGVIWALTPDGSFIQFDGDLGREPMPLPEKQQISAIVYGTQRYPWLSALLPTRDDSALDCATCNGRNWATSKPAGAVCQACQGLGWLDVTGNACSWA